MADSTLHPAPETSAPAGLRPSIDDVDAVLLDVVTLLNAALTQSPDDDGDDDLTDSESRATALVSMAYIKVKEASRALDQCRGFVVGGQ